MDNSTKKGILFDSTRCVGCGACYLACKERNNLPQSSLDFQKDDLSALTYTVVKQSHGRFVRRHVHALRNSNLCIGLPGGRLAEN